MKSKASIQGHPVHPILIAFPIAFFTGTVIFDLIAWLHGNDNLFSIGYYMEISGIVGAIAAAVPGVIDYFGTVPPNSSAKKRATKHGLTNVTMLMLFVIALVYRQKQNPNATILLSVELLGLILMTIAGWMGGTLVYKNQIAIVNRYANSGKWKEAWYDNDSGEIEVGKSDELKLNQMKLLHVGEKRIVLGRTEKGYVAFDDHCTHKGGSLAGGNLICGTVQCPWHGSQFNVHDGSVAAGPAEQKIQTYSLIEKNGKLFLSFV
jgi:uncharacterized membrane protein/nitrite reductase/ring-hydroxylating ferredoxin subunit